MVLSRIWEKYHGKAIRSKGSSGGIATLITNKYSIMSMMESQQWILTEIQEKDDASSLYIYNVYGSMHYRDKVTFWEDLSKDFEDLRGKNLIIARDFNTTIS